MLLCYARSEERPGCSRALPGLSGSETRTHTSHYTPSGDFAHDWLRAEGTAAGVDGDFAEAFWTLLCGGIGGGGVFAHARDQGVDGSHHEEVHGGCDQQERNHGIDELAVEELAIVEGKFELREVWCLYQRRDERRQKTLGERSDDAGEGGADDDAHSHVHNISTQDE